MSKVSQWRMTTSSEEAWKEMLAAFGRAKESISLIQFSLGHEGPIIEEFSALLREKVREGVRVRLLLDAIGSFMFYQSSLRAELEEAGIEIVFHRTTVPPSFKRFIPVFLRDHRKLIIVDEAEAHIGGVIIQERARTWRDTTVRFAGSLVDECLTVFEISWLHAKRMSPDGRVLSDGGKGEYFLAGNSFRLRDKELYRAMLRAIIEAKKNVYITTPYFAPTRDLRRALRYACQRGVDVRILLPKRSDNFFADILARFFYGWLLRHGIKVFHYTKSILHAKTITIDGAWATAGSCNLDWLSIWLNYELNIVSENRDLAAALETQFEADLKDGEEVRNARGWYGFFKSKS